MEQERHEMTTEPRETSTEAHEMSTEPALPEPLRASSAEELKPYVGRELGVSDWTPVTQYDVNLFAGVTGDWQWIHTDPARAAEGPFGSTIAHGYYTLSLAPALLAQVLALDEFEFAVNYGLNKLRFPAPLPVGDSVRMRVVLENISEFAGGAMLTLQLTFERSGAHKHVCVATAIYHVIEKGV
jgi:acyl dehydratase